MCQPLTVSLQLALNENLGDYIKFIVMSRRCMSSAMFVFALTTELQPFFSKNRKKVYTKLYLFRCLLQLKLETVCAQSADDTYSHRIGSDSRLWPLLVFQI